LDQPTSLTLLARLRAHDQGAWHRLLHLYTPLVAHWCKRWGVRGPDADDVSQEVFQAVAAGIEDFRRDRAGDTFRGWLRAITRHKVLDHFRRQQKQPEAQGGTDAQRRLQQVSEPATPPDDADDPEEELTRLYHRALELVRSEFEERTWQAFWRAAVDGQAPADIAADLGVTAAAVRKAKSRVLHRLREEVGELIV
jgi:RNA polymerase sigma-70 factor (ECF subfamily)